MKSPFAYKESGIELVLLSSPVLFMAVVPDASHQFDLGVGGNETRYKIHHAVMNLLGLIIGTVHTCLSGGAR